MPIPEARLQAIMASKDPEAALAACEEHHYSEAWGITDDGALIIYDLDNPPAWIPPQEE